MELARLRLMVSPACASPRVSNHRFNGCAMIDWRNKQNAKGRNLWGKNGRRVFSAAHVSGERRTEAANPNVETEIFTDNNVFGAQDRIDDVGKASWRRCVTPAQAFPVLRKR